MLANPGAAGKRSVPRTASAFVALVALAGAACGTRLPDSAFASRGSALGVRGGGATSQADTGVAGDAVAPGDQAPGGVAGGAASGVAGGGASGRTGPAGATGGGAQPGGAGGAGGGGPSGGGGGGQANFASDTGVTADTIKIGNITAVQGPLGPDTFVGPYHGARAFFLDLNARGGVNGRKVQFITCDDKENADADKSCARHLIEDERVFAIVASSTRANAAAPYINGQGVPDVGSIPISNAYYKFPMLFTLYGAPGYPRDGTQIGLDGKLYVRSTVQRFFKEKVGASKAAVVYYSEAVSKSAGQFLIEGLKREGYQIAYTSGEGENLAAPNWDAVALNLKNSGADSIFQAIDIAGFQKLCDALDRYQVTVKAAVSTIAGWGRSVGLFSAPCRNSVYATGFTVPYTSTANPQIAAMTAALKRFDGDWYANKMHQWAVDGWTAAKLVTDAIAQMGANVTRAGLVKYLSTLDPNTYTVEGLTGPGRLNWKPNGADFSKPAQECISVGRWQDSASDWVSQTSGGDFYCATTQWFSYTPVPDGST